MVLKGGVKGYSIPLNAPLYPTGVPIVYYGCRVMVALATVDRSSIDPLLPEGVDVTSDQPLAVFWVGEYPMSNVGSYREALIALQVSTRDLPLAYYIPYIYVTNDQALAAGRELLGAPKKLAEINMRWEGELLKGELVRGSKLLEITVQPREKGTLEGLKAIMPEEIPLLSIRTLPPIRDHPGIAQLVQWRAKIIIPEKPRILIGPAALKLARTIADPLDEIKVTSVITGLYTEFDMELHTDKILKEWILKP
jgi:acetoacetate decarboxylase